MTTPEVLVPPPPVVKLNSFEVEALYDFLYLTLDSSHLVDTSCCSTLAVGFLLMIPTLFVISP